MYSNILKSQLNIEKPKYNTCINDLPNEVLLKIFSNLLKDEILGSVRFVCQRWNWLTPEPTVPINKLYIANRNYPSTQDCCRLISTALKLKHISIACRNDLDVLLNTIAKRNRILRTLKVINCTTCDYSKIQKSMNLVLRNCKKLRGIVFYANKYRLRRNFKILIREKSSSRSRTWLYNGPLMKNSFDSQNLRLRKLPLHVSNIAALEQILQEKNGSFRISSTPNLKHFLNLIKHHIVELDVGVQISMSSSKM